MESNFTLLLTKQEVDHLLTLSECVDAVEEAFRLHGQGKAPAPGVLGLHAAAGGFHIKAGFLNLRRNYFAAKTNANFPRNPPLGLPLIQGVLLLFDSDDGRLLAVIDSIAITTLRTGAATAVAAKYLARANSKVLTLCGCGNQGRVQLKALRLVCPIETVFAWDISYEAAVRFAAEMSREVGVTVEPVSTLKPALRRSDLCATCTPAERFYIAADDIQPGTFIAAVGADSEHKQELDPHLFRAGNKVVTDVTDQCAKLGDLHHAITSGIATAENVHGQLGEIVSGTKTGRVAAEEITIFDSTGMALQDVAAGAVAYEKALAANVGLRVAFAA